MLKKVIILLIIIAVGLGLGVWLANRMSATIQPTQSFSKLLDTQIGDKADPTPSPTPTPACAILVFGGDLMFDRNIRTKAEARGSYDFLIANLQPVFDKADAIIANLEGPVTDNPSRSVGSVPGSTDNYFFTFSPKVIDTLSQWPFIVNLGNNHMLNFGQTGLAQTYSYLQAANLPYFGYVQPNQEQPTTLIHEINGLRFGFVNYNQFVTGGREQVFADMAQIRPQVDLLIVYPHWGNEYVPENSVQRQLAYEMVEAGADLIVGSHPHVVQGSEDYQGTRIYYSLGNMVFDQYFEEGVQNGLLVEAKVCQKLAESELGKVSEIEKNNQQQFSWTFTEHPIQMHKTGETIVKY